MRVTCVDCGEVIRVPTAARSGDVLDYPNRAGHGLHLVEEDGRWSARLAHQVSCPAGDEVLTLSDNAKPGDMIE